MPASLPVRQALVLDLASRTAPIIRRDGRVGWISILGRELGFVLRGESGVRMLVGLIDVERSATHSNHPTNERKKTNEGKS